RADDSDDRRIEKDAAAAATAAVTAIRAVSPLPGFSVGKDSATTDQNAGVRRELDTAAWRAAGASRSTDACVSTVPSVTAAHNSIGSDVSVRDAPASAGYKFIVTRGRGVDIIAWTARSAE